MRRNLPILFTILTIGLLSSCIITDNLKYSKPSTTFMDNLLKKDYDKCVIMMELKGGSNKNDAKLDLDRFRESLVHAFGENLEFSFMGSGDNMRGITKKPGTKIYLVQISNGKELGAVETIFDEKSDKIVDIEGLKIKDPIPNRTDYWVFGLVSLLVALFNIYVIRKVMRSNMADKWMYYLGIIVFNIGAISCPPAGGFAFNLYAIQPFLGIGYRQLGIMGSTFIAGIPLGGLTVLWLLKKGHYKKAVTSKKAAVNKK